MTQDVQPLTWQKRTNLEEHQQFFSKINEIIDNLAPTVDEAEAAIAQATAAIADANDAIATANAASAAASAAATQAQTAASTVAGYDTRLTAAEGDIDALQAADQAITGNVAALGTRMTAAESKNSQQDTDIAALQTADAQNVKISRINEYAIGLTGNQNSTGTKGFTAIKTPYLEMQNNFRPVIYYGDYDATDVQTAQRVRPITVFTSPNSTERPILRLETIDDASVTGVELTTTVYNSGINRGISIYARKSDGMAYVTAPSRGSTNISDYPANEVVTIDTLRKLGVI